MPWLPELRRPLPPRSRTPCGCLWTRRAAAFFDVDNTVMQGASVFHLARGLYRGDFFSARDIGRFAWQQAKFRLARQART